LPACSRFAAMPDPMCPSPMNPTRMDARSFGYFDW
jgi:hypothetical protein